MKLVHRLKNIFSLGTKKMLYILWKLIKIILTASSHFGLDKYTKIIQNIKNDVIKTMKTAQLYWNSNNSFVSIGFSKTTFFSLILDANPEEW